MLIVQKLRLTLSMQSESALYYNEIILGITIL